MNAPCSTTKKDCESRRLAARGYLSSSVFDFSCWHIFFFFGILVGEWSIHINFSTSAAFCAFGDAWATATELRVKNATRFLLGTDVRIDHVLSVAILPSLRFSLPPFVLRMKTCRARIYVVQFSDFRVSIFSSFSVFVLVAEHSQ